MDTDIDWTTTPPAKSGWFWFWPLGFAEPICVHVREDRYVIYAGGVYSNRYHVSNMNGKWWPVEVYKPPCLT